MLADFVALLAICSLVALVAGTFRVTSRRTAARVRSELFVADHRINNEFHQARHAMNDAAGQSWRNLAG